MGNADTKLHFRKAVIQLTTRTAPVDAADDEFWEQFWSDSVNSVQVSREKLLLNINTDGIKQYEKNLFKFRCN